MSRSISAGPLLLLLWQVAPVTAAPDSSGRVRLSVGYGTGGYHSKAEVVSCDGQTLESSTKEGSWTAPTGEVEAWLSSRVRTVVTAAGNSATPEVPARQMVGSLVALEASGIGVGGGVVHSRGTDEVTAPLLYLRFGSLEGGHARIDLIVPDPPANDDRWVRVAVGFNQGRQFGTRWLVGLARPMDGLDALLYTGDLFLPVYRDLELTLGTRLGWGSLYHEAIGAEGTYTSWRLAAGLRVSFGR